MKLGLRLAADADRKAFSGYTLGFRVGRSIASSIRIDRGTGCVDPEFGWRGESLLRLRQRTEGKSEGSGTSRGFAPPVPGPVHTVGNQGGGGGVDAVNGLLETARQTFVATRRAKARELALQMIEHLPKQRFHHVGVALLVWMRESLATRRSRPAHSEKL